MRLAAVALCQRSGSSRPSAGSGCAGRARDRPPGPASTCAHSSSMPARLRSTKRSCSVITVAAAERRGPLERPTCMDTSATLPSAPFNSRCEWLPTASTENGIERRAARDARASLASPAASLCCTRGACGSSRPRRAVPWSLASEKSCAARAYGALSSTAPCARASCSCSVGRAERKAEGHHARGAARVAGATGAARRFRRPQLAREVPLALASEGPLEADGAAHRRLVVARRAYPQPQPQRREHVKYVEVARGARLECHLELGRGLRVGVPL
eukprot:scaffold36031_cov63-Phaeocystis_antarctica.AAC.2